MHSLLLQAQPSLQRLFHLLPHLWKLRTSLPPHPDRTDVLDLTGDDSDAKHAQQATIDRAKADMLWVSTALEWGPFCSQATVMHWAEAMLQVSIKACTAWKMMLCGKARHLCDDSATRHHVGRMDHVFKECC